MKKTFKSKVDPFILVALIIVLLGTEIFMIINKILTGEIVVALIAAFAIYLYIETLYTVTGDHKLKIKSGFLYHKEIYIKSINKLRSVKDHRAWPALSSDRLEISYNRYGKIIVSPNKKTEFIKELRDVNPRIRIEEKP